MERQYAGREIKIKTVTGFRTFLCVFIFLFIIVDVGANAASKKPESPKNVIVVKDFQWQSGGMGIAGIIREITLQNKGKTDYKNLEIEAEFFSANDIPLGSLRATIHETLNAGSEGTFYNVSFGVMHSQLERTVVRVVRADVVETGSPSSPRDLILVKDWEWTGGQYGTEGILKEITLENTSRNHYKDIKIKVDNLQAGGSDKGGSEGYTSRIVIHDILPAGTTKTFQNINVGFKHPDSSKSQISVSNAQVISTKELRYRLAERGVRLKKKSDKAAKNPSEDEAEGQTQVSQETIVQRPSKLTLSERYREKLAQKNQAETTISPSGEGSETAKEIETREKEVAAVTPADEVPEEEENTSEGGIMGRVSKWGKSIVGVFKDDSEESEEEESYSEQEELSTEEIEIASSPGEATTVLEAPYEEDEEEVPLPKDDILVRSYSWRGGITGTIGTLEEITLENRSSISYTKIKLDVEFYSDSPPRPMGSNQVTIYEVLPAKSVKVFKRVEIGYLNMIPEEIDVKVLDASAIR